MLDLHQNNIKLPAQTNVSAVPLTVQITTQKSLSVSQYVLGRGVTVPAAPPPVFNSVLSREKQQSCEL